MRPFNKNKNYNLPQMNQQFELLHQLEQMMPQVKEEIKEGFFEIKKKYEDKPNGSVREAE